MRADASNTTAGRRLGAIEWLEQGRRCEFAVAAAMVVYAAVVLWVGRGTTLFFDEINVFAYMDGLHPTSLLRPLNGHLVLISRLVGASVQGTFGGNWDVLRLATIAGALATASLVFVLVRRAVGPLIALAATLLLLFLGTAWEILFTGSGITHVWAVAGGLGALLALEFNSRRADVVACMLLFLSICSFTFGAAFALGAAVRIVLVSGFSRRLWIVAAPLALYGTWVIWSRIKFADAGEDLRIENLLTVVNFALDEAAAVAGALAGGNYEFVDRNQFSAFETSSIYGPVLAAAAVIALSVRLHRTNGSPLLWALITTLVAIWLELGLGFGTGRSPETARYVYVGAVLVVLIGAEALRGTRISDRVKLALVVGVALALTANIARLRDGADFYRQFAEGVRAQLTAVEVGRNQIAPDYVPNASGFALLPAQRYLASVDRNGSPAYSADELRAQSEGIRAVADSTLVDGYALALQPVAGPAPADCTTLNRAGVSPSIVTADPPGLLLKARVATDVSVRRFADATAVDLGTLAPDQPTELRLPEDDSDQRWTIVLAPAPGGVQVCQLEPA